MFLVIIYPLLACRDISVDKLGVTKGDKSRRSVLQIVLTCDRGWIMLPQTKYDSHIFGHTLTYIHTNNYANTNDVYWAILFEEG